MIEIYSAILNKLDADLVPPVLGHVPENYNTFPYVKVNPLENNNNDTDLETGFSSTIQIETYSQYRGVTEVCGIADDIYNSLHRVTLPDTTSYAFSTIHQEFSNILTESDGLTRVSVQRFTVIFEPIPA
jgi:hypothetical protein